MTFRYFPHKVDNGILRHFYKKNPKYFENEIIVSASSHKDGIKNENIYDFNTGTYWIGYYAATGRVFNSFCFKEGFAYVTGYEVTSYAGTMKPSKWSFAGSNDNITWSDEVPENHVMSAPEIHYVKWNHGPYRCFRLTSLANVHNTQERADYAQIEIFGYYCKDITKIKTCKCNMFRFGFFYHVFTFIVTC